jgi:hypothetical protein
MSKAIYDMFSIEWEGVLVIKRTSTYVVILYRDCETELLMVEKKYTNE